MSINNKCNGYTFKKCAEINGKTYPRLLEVIKPNGDIIYLIKDATFVKCPVPNCEGVQDDCFVISGTALDYNFDKYEAEKIVLTSETMAVDAIFAILNDCCPECLPGELTTELKAV